MTGVIPVSSADRPLRILYLGMQWDYGDPARGTSFEHDNFYPALREWRRTLEVRHFDFMALGQAHGVARMSRLLLDEVQRFAPDVLFGIWFNEERDPERQAIRAISRTTPCKTIGWFCDSHWRYDSFDRPWSEYLDVQTTTSQSAYARFVSDGLAAKVIKTQWACAPDYRCLPDVARDIDVSFVGQRYGSRGDVIDQIRRAGFDVRVFGAGWPSPSERLSFESMVRLFNRSRINLNLNNAVDASFKQIKGRNFEVPACGGFLLTETAENLDEYFRFGEEVETYGGIDDLIDKIRYYLAHVDAREHIAAAGNRRAMAEHTYAHRFDRIFAFADCADKRNEEPTNGERSVGNGAPSVHTRDLTTGLLVVATHRYYDYAWRLFESARRYFHPTAQTQFVLFTDRLEAPEGIWRVPQAHQPWPGMTLMRYHMYLEQEAALRNLDYLFCCDADMCFVDHIGPEILGDRVATLHPGFFQAPRHRFSYETRASSRAYIGPDEGHWYFAGGFNGGRADALLETARAIRDMVDDDGARGLVAVWHDESYLNRALCDTPPSLMLSPSYCYPETATLGLRPKLLALDKPHAELRR